MDFKKAKGEKMKTILAILSVLLITGCATLTYESSDGTKVTYTRFCTGSDSIKGIAGNASIEAQGQKQLDPAVIELLLKALTAAGAL